jgi:hypothetical protein
MGGRPTPVGAGLRYLSRRPGSLAKAVLRRVVPKSEVPMLKRMLALAAFAALFVPTQSFAVDHSKQWALGYFFESAPIGVRYMIQEKVGLDFGFGFDSEEGPDPTSTDPDDTSSNSAYTLDLGVVFNLVHMDRADFFVRPGFAWRSVPFYQLNGPNPTTSERASDVAFGATLGGEWHATDNLSLTFAHGLAITSSHGVSPGEVVGGEPDAATSINTAGFTTGGSSIGFRWYFD